MVSPPYSISVTHPESSDIASQFPALNITDKENILAWLNTQMNTYGINVLLALIGTNVSGNATYGSGYGSTPSANAGAMLLYYDTDYSLKQNSGDLGIVEYAGVPPGTIVWDAGAASGSYALTNFGYAVANGQAISRTTYARLFNRIGTTFGSGDGATTFNLPNLIGAFVYGGTPAGATGGSTTITQANLPNYSLTVTDPGHGHAVYGTSTTPSNTVVIGLVAAGSWALVGTDNETGPEYITTAGGSNKAYIQTSTTGVTVASGGSGTAYYPPYVTLIPYIKL